MSISTMFIGVSRARALKCLTCMANSKQATRMLLRPQRLISDTLHVSNDLRRVKREEEAKVENTNAEAAQHVRLASTDSVCGWCGIDHSHTHTQYTFMNCLMMSRANASVFQTRIDAQNLC